MSFAALFFCCWNDFQLKKLEWIKAKFKKILLFLPMKLKQQVL